MKKDIEEELSKMTAKDKWQYYDSKIDPILETTKYLLHSLAIQKVIYQSAELWGCSDEDISYEDTGYFMPKEVYEKHFQSIGKEREVMTLFSNEKIAIEAELDFLQSKGLSQIKYLNNQLKARTETYSKYDYYGTEQKKQNLKLCFDKYLKPYLDDKIAEEERDVMSEKNLEKVLKIGMEAGFWDRNNKLLLVKKSDYSSGKKFLGQLSQFLSDEGYINKGYSIDEKGRYFSELFVQLDGSKIPTREGNDAFKEFDGKLHKIYDPIKSKFQECKSRIYPKNNSQ